ncbi:hypothetical protein ACFW4X_10155 [Streptomyces smyrnaeus]|uniref:hypothetical protein n=1 Tax=Streptomyces smyrnaeus TaxID=1387713 RepID=UPI0036C58C22
MVFPVWRLGAVAALLCCITVVFLFNWEQQIADHFSEWLWREIDSRIPGEREMSDDFAAATSALLAAILVVAVVEIRTLYARSAEAEAQVRQTLIEDSRRRISLGREHIERLRRAGPPTSDEAVHAQWQAALDVDLDSLLTRGLFSQWLRSLRHWRLKLCSAFWFVFAFLIAGCEVAIVDWLSLPGDPQYEKLAKLIEACCYVAVLGIVVTSVVAFAHYRDVRRFVNYFDRRKNELSAVEKELRTVREEREQLLTEHWQIYAARGTGDGAREGARDGESP